MISYYILWFTVFSVAGWIFECIFAAATQHHWENRGFLFGPLCPIYGVAGVIILLVFDIPAVAALPLWATFLCCMFGSAVLEYSVSFVMETLFHAVWWDYSTMPLNLNGRICLPASLLFGCFGIMVTELVLPFTHIINSYIPALLAEGVALILVGLLAADIAITVAGITDLMERLNKAEEEVNRRMEDLVVATTQTGTVLPKALTERDWLSREYLRATALHLTATQRRIIANVRRTTSKRTADMLATMQEFIEGGKQAADAAKAYAEQAAEDAKEKAGQAANTAKQRSKQAADVAKEKAEEQANKAREFNKHAADTAREKTNLATASIKEHAEAIQERNENKNCSSRAQNDGRTTTTHEHDSND